LIRTETMLNLVPLGLREPEGTIAEFVLCLLSELKVGCGRDSDDLPDKSTGTSARIGEMWVLSWDVAAGVEIIAVLFVVNSVIGMLDVVAECACALGVGEVVLILDSDVVVAEHDVAHIVGEVDFAH